MNWNPEAAAARALPSTEALIRLQQHLATCVNMVETKTLADPSELREMLSKEQVDTLAAEIGRIFSTPIGFDLLYLLMPTLLEISKKGARQN